MVAKILEHWNTHISQSSSGLPDRRRRRGVTEGVWRRSLPRHISLTCLKNVVVTVPAFQPGGDLGGSRWKPAQTHFQAISGLESWNTHRHSECSRVFQCSSSGSAWAASKSGRRWAWQPAGSNHTVARIRSAPPDPIRPVGVPSQGVDQPAPIKVAADEVVAEHSPSHCHLCLAHWNTRLFHWNTRANPSVPDQIVAQRPETHNAHIFSVIGDGRKILERWNTHIRQSSSGPAGPSSAPRCHRGACGVGVCGGTLSSPV